MNSTALILGITGGLGHAVTAALAERGWNIRALHRDPAKAAEAFPADVGIDWVRGDAMLAADVLRAAKSTTAIVHGVNPPGYRDWRRLAIPMLSNSIAAARESGARILFPGNVYNFGADAWPLVREDSPQHSPCRKGAVRVEMETMLRSAAEKDGVRTLILRAGDFFGSRGPGGWFEQVLIKPGKPVRAVIYPGQPEAGHAWAYLPDLAETFARLLARQEELATFETFHFGGHYLTRGIDMAEVIRRVADAPNAPIRKLPWPALRIASPFSRTCRELLDVRYLWQVPIQLDNHKLLHFLGGEPHTPLDLAVSESLTALGCLEGDSAQASVT